VFIGKGGTLVRTKKVAGARAIPFFTEGLDEVRPKALDILAKYTKD
jgi:hypothetical protein